MEKDFFISHSHVDRRWAEWIAWQLEEEGYTTALQPWDLRPGSNAVDEINRAIQQAKYTIVTLSPDYLEGTYAQPEWSHAFGRDPKGARRALLPVQVRDCRAQLRGLLSTLVQVDLVGLDEQSARDELLSNIRQISDDPALVPDLPRAAHLAVAEPPPFPAGLPAIWNLPHDHNRFFTGREEILSYLRESFHTADSAGLVQPLALVGLGGIGKTQVAIEYAHRYRSDYEAVLWVAADSRESLISSFLNIAEMLDLPEKESKNQDRTIAAVKSWFRHHAGWLLIVDNVDDLALAQHFLPLPATKGHILLTTRSQATGRLAQKIELDVLDEEQGALLLLRRAGLIAPTEELEQAAPTAIAAAQGIVRELGGLPLALGQAGAYIEEAGCSLAVYLALYRSHHTSLLSLRGHAPDYAQSVATTWELAFARVQHASAEAAEMLRLCAFLAPDDIPEEIFTQAAQELGPALKRCTDDPLAIDSAMAELRKYSLVRRDPAQKTLAIHHLVQTVLRDEMNRSEQRRWAKRVVRAINQIFPRAIEFTDWPRCQRYLSQVQRCAQLIEQFALNIKPAADLLDRAGFYLQERAQYAQAEKYMRQALAIAEQAYGANDAGIVRFLNDLANLSITQARYAEAESLYRRALAIREQQFGSDHSEIAVSLINLAYIYKKQARFAEAEPLVLRARSIDEKVFGPDHPEVATDLNALASLYQHQGKYAEAEPLFQRALAIREQQPGPDHPDTAQSLNHLALLYQDQDKDEQAESLLQRALAIAERQLGPGHLDTAATLNNLALTYQSQGKYAGAEALYRRALDIAEEQLGPDHPDTATSLCNLASLYRHQGKVAEAESLFRRALAIDEAVFGPDHPEVATDLHNLAGLYRDQGRYEEAESLLRRALAIREKTLGAEHPDTAKTRRSLADLLRDTGRVEEAEALAPQSEDSQRPDAFAAQQGVRADMPEVRYERQ